MRQDGFTLTEVLIAFAIMSLILIVSFGSFSDGLLRLTKAEQMRRDITVAQSIISAAEVGERLVPEGWRITFQDVDESGDNTVFQRKIVRVFKGADTAPLLETVAIERVPK